ncbi:conserved hypothetical protein [Talaromyces stipitatus ATCC 10500]|uniref:Zn(2)-C6 fungal-type domain-containing protein n=1 Tax=Talaromyces stipitatus (strain ATCC 10500 / CBS 375.48 / QM 6759 / NRRL 1006) TaxID=441959 RepID=B8MP71_TALSN|nr:uncharacterized protein TSTA_105220 [Talaromyces stipitatus ATCC 10500]EED14310.1 conserved hypothetical protein [Talaromyces stipitatus ATCC 10500]
MVSLWPWKGEDNSPASFEKTLSTLSTKATETNAQLDKLRQQARRFKALWTLYSVFIYLLYSTIDVLVLGWQNWGYWEWGAVLGGPFVIYTVRTVGSRMFDYRISRSQSYLDSLNKQRDETIEKLKIATKYNSTQQLLEKYGGESPKPTKAANKNTAKKKDNNEQQQKTSSGNVPGRTGLQPPPTANIRRFPSNNNPQGQSPYNQPRQSPPNEYLQGKPLPPPPSAVPTYTDEPGFAPNAFPPSSQPQYASGGAPKWYDRLMDVLLGEDETSPKNRLVLICQNCRLVNGQAPPGIKSLGELGRWRCGNCGAWNGEETEARKVIASIQREATEEREAAQNAENEKSESEDINNSELAGRGDDEVDEEDERSEQEEEHIQSVPETPGTTQSEVQSPNGLNDLGSSGQLPSQNPMGCRRRLVTYYWQRRLGNTGSMATTRRNGQLSSCEPCRKSKLRCDHKTPTCDRCLHRGQANDCFYHPAPLTRTLPPQAFAPKGSSRRRRKQQPGNQVIFRLNKTPSTVTQTSPLATSLNTGINTYGQSVGQWTSMQKRPMAPGYLGLTFSEDIFNESHGTISLKNRDQNQFEDAQNPPADLDKAQLGAQVLLHLEKICWFHEIIKFKNKVSPGWFLGPPLTDSLCIVMEKVYGSAIQGSSDTQASLLRLSYEIFTNTMERIAVTQTMTIVEYMSLIAARWETIGLLFAVLGSVTFHIPADDPVFTNNPWNIDRKQLRSISIANSEICSQFCNSSGLISDPLCWLMTQQTVLLTLVAGKNDFRTWQKLGDLSTVTYAIGLHRPDSALEENCPFFLTEIRKRVLACAYSLDKELATALGLPPRICSRYVCIELPLDLSYDEIISTPSAVEIALQNLDPNGWNTKGDFTLEVRLRIALLTGFMRENILELSMSYQTGDLLDRVEKMMEDSRQMQQDLPQSLRWTPNEAVSNFIDESRSMTHLEFTYQELLLYRIVLKRLGIKSQSLIHTSCEIISTLLNLITLRTKSAKAIHDMSWDLCYMGLPAAGILATELLGIQPTSIPPPIHTRSEMIQKLSIFRLASQIFC